MRDTRIKASVPRGSVVMDSLPILPARNENRMRGNYSELPAGGQRKILVTTTGVHNGFGPGGPVTVGGFPVHNPWIGPPIHKPPDHGRGWIGPPIHKPPDNTRTINRFIKGPLPVDIPIGGHPSHEPPPVRPVGGGISHEPPPLGRIRPVIRGRGRQY